MKLLRDFVAAGKSVIGIRTASHAFSLRGKSPKPPLATWEGWDPEVFGGHYVNHHPFGPRTEIRLGPAAAADEILKDVDVAALVGNGSLYRVNPLAPGTKALLIGAVPNRPSEPVAWTFQRPLGGKSFYTSLGHPEDFKNPAFCRLLSNAIRWAAER